MKPLVLRVTDWSEVYENNRTRELKRLDWVPMPNRMDGDGYTDLVDHPNGSSHLGAWTAIVRIASRCEPRGTLLRDSKTPHTPQSLARISRLPATLFEESIPRFITIGWLEAISIDSNTLQDDSGKSHLGAGKSQAPAEIPHDDAPRARAFGTERKNGKKETTTAGAAVQIGVFEFPETLAAARRRFPSTDPKMAKEISTSARKALPDATDVEIASAIEICAPNAKKSAAFFIGTVPGVVVTIRARVRGSPKAEEDPEITRQRAVELWQRVSAKDKTELEKLYPDVIWPNGEENARLPH